MDKREISLLIRIIKQGDCHGIECLKDECPLRLKCSTNEIKGDFIKAVKKILKEEEEYRNGKLAKWSIG